MGAFTRNEALYVPTWVFCFQRVLYADCESDLSTDLNTMTLIIVVWQPKWYISWSGKNSTLGPNGFVWMPEVSDITGLQLVPRNYIWNKSSTILYFCE